MKLTSLPPLEHAKMFNELLALQGWTLLCEMLEEGEIAAAQKELEEGTHKDLASVEKLQYKISVCRQMMAFPKQVLSDIQQDLEAKKDSTRNDVEEDPYYGTAAEIDDANVKEMEEESI